VICRMELQLPNKPKSLQVYSIILFLPQSGSRWHQTPANGVTPESGSPRFILAVEILNPFHRFGVGDLSKITLSG
jgi:hypothetical protein